MIKKTIAVTTLLLAFAVVVLAHGKEQHLMGTVTAIGGNTITVETTAKKIVTVNVSDKTKFAKSGAAATLTDLKVGDRVVIHAEQAGGKLVASQVRFGVMKSTQRMKGSTSAPVTNRTGISNGFMSPGGPPPQ